MTCTAFQNVRKLCIMLQSWFKNSWDNVAPLTLQPMSVVGWLVCLQDFQRKHYSTDPTKLSAPKLTFSEEPDKFAFIFF